MARKKYSCDFETTTKEEDCRVWAYGWMEIGNTKNYQIGNSMSEFMEWMEEEQADCYFHNQRFDGEFIVSWLLKNGYEWSKKPRAKTFNTIISGMGQWYQIDICYGYKGKTKLHTKIYDSLKKLPFPVKKIAKDFKLDVLKGDIDYHIERPIGWEITEKEHAYIHNDIYIVAKALEVQFKQGMTKMTNGSDSLSGFKDVISKKTFEKLFPVFSHKLDANIRLAYRGGFTWVNKRYQNMTIEGGMCFDVNSLYPSVMYNKMLPYGLPKFFKGEYVEDKQYPLWISHVTCSFILKEGYIPTIQLKKNMLFRANEYLESSDGEIVDLYVTNVDWELIQEHYYVDDLTFHEGWKFRAVQGLFNQFIDKWMYIKINSEGAVKALAKLMLNSLYGKFASNPNVTGKIPYLKDDGSVGFKMGEEEYKDPIYTAMGVFITSWARHTTITTAQSVYDRIIYCDTDSLHICGHDTPVEIEHLIDPDKLGYWKLEGHFETGKFLRQKTYVENYYTKMVDNKMVMCHPSEATNRKFEVKCAGMPDRVKEKVTFENFEVGFTSHGKLLPKHVNGGVVLVDTEFTIK